jgi:hypothetical protein
MGPVGRLLQQIRASFHAACGWLCFRAGLRLQARNHYERVLQLRGDDFSAYVHLGRIAFAIGDYTGWRRELEHARRTNGAAFARLRHPSDRFEPRIAGTDADPGAPPDNFSATGDRATWRSLLAPDAGRAAGTRLEGDNGQPGPRRTRRPGDAPAQAGSEQTTGANAPFPFDAEEHGDDCSSSSERRRLRSLGPIRAQDCRNCDLDELSRRLTS